MDKLAALTILLAVAVIIYLLNPGSQTQVPAPTPLPITAPALEKMDTQQPNIILKNTNESAHNHETTDSQVEIPQFIQDSLETRRIPASELVEQHHPDGSISVDLKGQFQHVPVAVMGQDGKPRIIEKVITPSGQK